MAALTEAKIRNWPLPEKGSTRIRDDRQRGLFLQVSMGGAKGWVVRYSAHGRQQQRLVGRWPEVSLSEARERAARLLGALHGGKQVASELTVSTVWERDYWPLRSKELARPENDAAQFRLHIEPHIGHVPMSELRRATILDLHARWKRKGLSGRTPHRVVSHFLHWAIDREMIDITVPKPPSAPGVRDVVPTLEDMRRIWKWSATDRRPALWRWLLLTGARRNEVAQLEWRELDLDTLVWTCPTTRMKARRLQRWPIIEPMLPLPRKRSAWVFPNRAGDGPTSIEFSVQIKRSGLDIAPHDLRRGLATCWAKYLGASDDLIGAQLAHAPQTVTASHYQRDDRLEQRRELMIRWHDLLTK